MSISTQSGNQSNAPGNAGSAEPDHRGRIAGTLTGVGVLLGMIGAYPQFFPSDSMTAKGMGVVACVLLALTGARAVTLAFRRRLDFLLALLVTLLLILLGVSMSRATLKIGELETPPVPVSGSGQPSAPTGRPSAVPSSPTGDPGSTPNPSPAEGTNPPLPPGSTYLTDLERNPSNTRVKDAAVNIKTRSYDHSLTFYTSFFNRSYFVEYPLNGKYKSFTGFVGVRNEAPELSDKNVCQWRITADGRELFSGRTLRGEATRIPDKDITGVVHLRIEVRQISGGNDPCALADAAVR